MAGAEMELTKNKQRPNWDESEVSASASVHIHVTSIAEIHAAMISIVSPFPPAFSSAFMAPWWIFSFRLSLSYAH